MISIYHPPGYIKERSYIYNVVLNHFLGISYRSFVEERSDVRITMSDGMTEGEILIADTLFQTPPALWLTKQSLPNQPLHWWQLSNVPALLRLPFRHLPIIYGNNEAVPLQSSAEQTRIGIDLFGSMFFMLTRYEEVVKKTKDDNGRFPSTASLALQEGFLDRPIVNEYVELLWCCLQMHWPRLQRKPQYFRQYVSHDVDWLYCTAGKSLFQIMRGAVADLIVRRDFSFSLRRISTSFQTMRGNIDADLYHTFDLIMDISERMNMVSAFYFITEPLGGRIDGDYTLEDSHVRELIRRIHERGHEIGLHPSYYSFRSSGQVRRELSILQTVLEQEGIHMSKCGGRQHYLRWEAPTTWQVWEDAGLDYDSTLGFADRIGFRCGTCYEYPVFNLVTAEALKLRERPLLAMDVTMLGRNYMKLTTSAALQEMRRLRDQCKMYQGNFTLLWHNSQLVRRQDVQLYQEVLNTSSF